LPQPEKPEKSDGLTPLGASDLAQILST